MIFDTLENAEAVARMDARLKAGLDFIRSKEAAALAPGRYELADGSTAIIDTYETVAAREKRLEAHRKFIDIQYIAEGTERMDHAFVNGLEADCEYNEEKDIVFFREPKDVASIIVNGASFAVFYPNDAHKPGVMAGETPSAIRKVVVKVLCI